MDNLYLVNNNFLSTNVSIIFQVQGDDGKITKFTRTLSNIAEDTTDDDIYAAAAAVAKLYKHDKFDVKLITTNLLENDSVETSK